MQNSVLANSVQVMSLIVLTSPVPTIDKHDHQETIFQIKILCLRGEQEKCKKGNQSEYC